MIRLAVVETVDVLAVVVGSPAQNLVPAKVAPRHEGGEAPAVLCRVEATQ